MAELAALAASAAAVVAEAAPAAATIAEVASVAAPIGTALTVGGTLLAGQAAKRQGEAAAQSEERAATDERAIASREAEDRRREVGLVLSKQKAGAAASGGGVTNPTILDLMSDTASRGDYYARSATAAGENRAAGLTDQAAASRYRGDAAFTGSMLQGLGQAVGGVNDYFNPKPKRAAGYY